MWSEDCGSGCLLAELPVLGLTKLKGMVQQYWAAMQISTRQGLHSQRRCGALSHRHPHPRPSRQRPARTVRAPQWAVVARNSQPWPSTLPALLTLPPSTSRLSRTMGWCPASARYLAVDRPARPAPAMTMRSGLSGRGAACSSAERDLASWKLAAESKSGLGKSAARVCSLSCLLRLSLCALAAVSLCVPRREWHCLWTGHLGP